MKPNHLPRPRAPLCPSSTCPDPFWTRPLPPPTGRCSASEPPATLAPSQQGTDTLLDRALERETSRLLALVYSPLFPETAPYTSLAEIPPSRAEKDAPILKAVARALQQYHDRLTAAAGHIGHYLHCSEDDIRTAAMRLARKVMPPTVKLILAQRLLGTSVPGKTLEAQLARLSDARYWRRALRVRILRAREHFFLRLGLIGKRQEAYASDAAVALRTAQLKRQREWMKATVLIPRDLEEIQTDEPYEPLTLEKVSAGPKQRFAKLYTFVKAMDTLAQEGGLSAAMVTLTLEPQWHPNPSHGQCSWNDASPRDAHRSLCRRWQAIQRDLHRSGIRLSGLRVAEPHADACPHWHIWLLYLPEYETRILATIMRYFPNKMKVRSPSAGGRSDASADRIYDTCADLLASASRAPSYPKEVAQVEVSRIDRSISSGASYAMKYLLKTVDAGEALTAEAGLLQGQDAATRKKRKQHAETARRVDAYRSTWGLNQGQLFGVAKCQTIWDELRRLAFAPHHPTIRALWTLARGGDEEGRIVAGSGQRGDAVGFIKMLGGLDACRKVHDDHRPRYVFGLLAEKAINAYGESFARTRGVQLLLKERIQVVKLGTSPKTGKQTRRRCWRTRTSEVASARTRWTEWMLVPRHVARQTIALPRLLQVHAQEQRKLHDKRLQRRASLGSLSLLASPAPA